MKLLHYYYTQKYFLLHKIKKNLEVNEKNISVCEMANEVNEKKVELI